MFFVEEPMFDQGSMRLRCNGSEKGVQVVVPHLPEGLRSEIATAAVMKDMIRRLFIENGISEYVFWYYTPMALSFTDDFNPIASVYDCMDELSAFKGANSRLPELEKQLFEQVDLVFTGGQVFIEAKRNHIRQFIAFPAASIYHILVKPDRYDRSRDQEVFRIRVWGSLESSMSASISNCSMQLLPGVPIGTSS